MNITFFGRRMTLNWDLEHLLDSPIPYAALVVM